MTRLRPVMIVAAMLTSDYAALMLIFEDFAEFFLAAGICVIVSALVALITYIERRNC